MLLLKLQVRSKSPNMFVKLKVRLEGCADPKVVDGFLARGIAAKLAKSSVIVELPRNNGHFLLPEGLPKDSDVILEMGETWKLLPSGPVCTVACSRVGNPLRPYRKLQFYPNDEQHVQALFSVPNSAVVVAADLMHQVAITLYETCVWPLQRRVNVSTKTLYRGLLEDLKMPCFSAAAFAAVQKVQCQDCDCLHFAVGAEESMIVRKQ